MVALMPGDFVKVKVIKNLPGRENTPMVLGWNSREWPIPPGHEAVVPLEAVVNAFGDPRSMANVQNIPLGDPRQGSVEKLFIADRAAEVRRLRMRYGMLDGYDDGFVDFQGNFLGPVAEVYTLDGDRITTVLEDPKGDTVNPAQATQMETNNQEALIEALRRQVDALSNLVENSQAKPVKSLSDLPSDEPEDETTTDTEPDPLFDDANEEPGDVVHNLPE